MGQFFSHRRRDEDYVLPLPPPSRPAYLPPSPVPPPPPAALPPSVSPTPPPLPLPPPPQPPSYSYNYPYSFASSSSSSSAAYKPPPGPPYGYYPRNPLPPPPPQPYYGYYYGPPAPQYHWPAPMPIAPLPRPVVQQEKEAKRLKNEINVHKDSVRLVPDAEKPEQMLVSFTFDATVDGSFTVYYFAREVIEPSGCTYVPVYPDYYTPRTVPFEKGIFQSFTQPSGAGIDLGFFSLDELSKPMNEEVFPLVICGEAPHASSSEAEQQTRPNAQFTLAVIEKSKEAFEAKVVNQILRYDGERYELKELFGMVNASEEGAPDENGGDEDLGKECVICLTEPRDTAAIPCRHLSMCGTCANELVRQSNKCPICRQPIEKLMVIKVNKPEL